MSFTLEKLLSGMCKMGFSLYLVFHNKTVLVAHHELMLFLDSSELMVILSVFLLIQLYQILF